MSAPSLTTGVGSDVAGSVRGERPVFGLECPSCVQSLESALRAVPGVTRATVNLATSRAFVEYDPTAEVLIEGRAGDIEDLARRLTFERPPDCPPRPPMRKS